MAEIEDVAGAAGGLIENVMDAVTNQIRLGEESDGVEIALDGAGVIELMPGLIQGGAPVEAKDIGTGFAHGGQ